MKNRIKMPEFVLEDIEDYYTYYVLILGINSDDFWECDIDFLASVVENKSAFDGYVQFEQDRKAGGK